MDTKPDAKPLAAGKEGRLSEAEGERLLANANAESGKGAAKGVTASSVGHVASGAGKSVAPEELLAERDATFGTPAELPLSDENDAPARIDATLSEGPLPSAASETPNAIESTLSESELPPSAANQTPAGIDATLSEGALPPSAASETPDAIESTLSESELPLVEAKTAAPLVRTKGPSVIEAPKQKGDLAPETVRRAPKRGFSKIFWGLGLGLGLIGIVATLLLLFAPGYLKTRVEEEARSRGVVLVFSEIEYGLSRVVLTDVSLALVGVPDFRAKASVIEVDLADWEPTALRASGLSLMLSGSDVIDQLSDWKSKYGKKQKAPVFAKDAQVDLRIEPGDPTGILLSQVTLNLVPEKGSIEAGKTRFLGREMGPTNVVWVLPDDGFTVEIRPQLAPLSALTAMIWSSKEGPLCKLSLARTQVAPLQAIFGIPPGSDGISIEGNVEMKLPSLAKKAPLEASIQLVVRGYVPPHPKELNGILFGDATKVRAKALIAENFGGAKLSQVTVEAGALLLSGSGDVVRNGFDARVLLKLKGSIPCTSLASSAAIAHLGGPLGRIAGGLASGALSGSVFVSLSVDALASDMKAAKLDQHASIGCKVGLPGLPQIVFK